MNTSERWKESFGFEGIYEVSTKGRVRRIAPAMGARVGRVLKPYDLNGYHMVYLRKGGKYHDRSIHRLMMQSFFLEHGQCVNHKNGVRNDNRIENLEWCSTRENLLHATRQLGKRRGNEHWNSHLTASLVSKIKRMYATGKYRQQDIADAFGVSRPQISRVIRGKSWHHLS